MTCRPPRNSWIASKIIHQKKVIFRESSPRGPSEEPVEEEADVVDNIAKEGEDEKPFSTNQVGRVHHDQGGEGSRDDLDRNLIFRNIFGEKLNVQDLLRIL